MFAIIFPFWLSFKTSRVWSRSRDSVRPLQKVRKSLFEASYHHFQTGPHYRSSEYFYYFSFLFAPKMCKSIFQRLLKNHDF